MTAHSYTVANEAEAQRLAQSVAAQRPNDPTMGWRPAASIAGKAEIVINGGKITSMTSMTKTEGAVTQYAVTQPRPGWIALPGMGETTVEAAKAGGLIPPTWKEGDPLPFGDAPKAPQKGTEAGDDKATDQDKPKGELTVLEHRAKVAGQILDTVDRQYGAQVTDHFIDLAVETGEIPETGLPPTVTPAMVQQVVAGYVAQADAILAPVGASVSMLQDMPTDGELQQARRYTMAKAAEDLADLGRKAVDRLAQLPKSDPEGFLQMIADMPQKERQCIRQDPKTGEYRVKVPGRPEMSFGAAVHIGLDPGPHGHPIGAPV